MGGGPSGLIKNMEDELAAGNVPNTPQFQKKRTDELIAQNLAAREADLAKGRARGQELFGEGSLGRVGSERSADIQDVIARRRANLEGFTPEEKSAMEAEAIGGIGQSSQTALRQLRGVQGAQGLRGGTAAAQQVGVLQNAANQEALARRDLFLKNMGAKREGLGQFEQSVSLPPISRNSSISGLLSIV